MTVLNGLEGKNGNGIKTIIVNDNNELIVTLDDNTKIIAGTINIKNDNILPTEGTIGQILIKNSDKDFDVAWTDYNNFPLIKNKIITNINDENLIFRKPTLIENVTFNEFTFVEKTLVIIKKNKDRLYIFSIDDQKLIFKIDNDGNLNNLYQTSFSEIYKLSNLEIENNLETLNITSPTKLSVILNNVSFKCIDKPNEPIQFISELVNFYGDKDKYIISTIDGYEYIITINIDTGELINYIKNIKINGEGGGTNNYNELINLPSINNKILKGNSSLEDIGISSISNEDLERICI